MKKKDNHSVGMDKIEGTDNVFKNIYITASTILIFLIQFYVILISNEVDIINFASVKNKALSIFLQFFVQVVGFSLVNVFVYWCVYKIRQLVWLKSNKHKYFRGKWLHIHDKDNMRIGVVTIQQSFSNLNVSGFNMSPRGKNIADTGRTKWNYISSSLYPKQLSGIEFFGCYVSRKENGTTNQGIHIFDSVDMDQKGYPVRMMGSFSDTFNIASNRVKNISDKKGSIFFFKMSPQLENYLYDSNGLNTEKLRSLPENDVFAQEPYVLELKRIIAKNNQN